MFGIFGRLVIVTLGSLALIFLFGLFLKDNDDLQARDPLNIPALGSRSIAVLPFVDLSDDSNETLLGSEMTNEILSHLTKLRDIKVVSQNSSMFYHKSQKSIGQIAQELGVATILKGSVQRNGDRVLIKAQLLEAAKNEELWAESYDRKFTEIFAIQSQVAQSIAVALETALSPTEKKRLKVRPTNSMRAYHHYLRAYSTERRGYEKENLEKAIDHYKQAINEDSSFARAFARIGILHAAMYWEGFDRSVERLSMAKRAIDSASRLNPNDAVVHEAQGFYHYWGFRDYDRALEEFHLARELEPGNGQLVENVGYIQRRMGRFQEAIINLENALIYDPRSGLLSREIGLTYLALRRPELAEQAFNRGIAFAPSSSSSYLDKAQILVNRDRNTARAREVLTEGMKLANASLFAWRLVDLDISDGNFVRAHQRLEAIPDQIREGQTEFLPKDAIIAAIYKYQGENLKAQTYYEKARLILERQILLQPDDPRVRADLGKVYAHLGLVNEAVAQSKLAVNLLPTSLDALDGPEYLEDLAEVYTILNMADKAIDMLDHLLDIPSQTLYVGALEYYKIWEPLRDHARFKALLEAHRG